MCVCLWMVWWAKYISSTIMSCNNKRRTHLFSSFPSFFRKMQFIGYVQTFFWYFKVKGYNNNNKKFQSPKQTYFEVYFVGFFRVLSIVYRYTNQIKSNENSSDGKNVLLSLISQSQNTRCLSNKSQHFLLYNLL